MHTKKGRLFESALQVLACRGLPALFVGDGELLAAVTTTGSEHAAAVGGGHAGTEAVLVHALAVGRLERSFHDISFLYFTVDRPVFTDGVQR